MKRYTEIPSSHPVRPIGPNDKAKDRATCGHCGLSWDDAIATALTPTPSARCPFEYFHVYSQPIEKTVIELVAWSNSIRPQSANFRIELDHAMPAADLDFLVQELKEALRIVYGELFMRSRDTQSVQLVPDFD